MAEVKRRKKDHTYKLIVDPDRLILGDTLRDAVLKILIKSGGVVERSKLLVEFEKVIKKRKKKLKVTSSSLLSRQQRMLQDAGILKIFDSNGDEVLPSTRTALLR